MRNYLLIAAIITIWTFAFSERGWVALTMFGLYGGCLYLIGRELKLEKKQ